MSFQTVLTLQDLVIQNVLCKKDLPIPNLEYLPRVLILQLYKEAIMGGHKEMLKKMVLSCPLACLYVDYLVKTGDLMALRTLLYGLSSLIFNNVHPRKWKLKAIDFRLNQDCPNYQIRRTVFFYYLRELEVNADHWSWKIMEQFCFILIKMRNLRVLHLSKMSPQVFSRRSINRSQIPLKTLSPRGCPLKEKDLRHLSMCLSTDQLKCLDLSSFSMKDMSPEPVWVQLKKVAHTLETLVLEFCEITESQLNAISPALGHCSQLKTFSFCGNQIPLIALKNLLSHTASLPLEQAKYPAPVESFDEILGDFWIEINPMKFDQVRKELMQLVKDISPVHDIQIYSYNCVLHLKHTDFIA
ncbi:PRAME family member 12-like [Urocitellus parryii]